MGNSDTIYKKGHSRHRLHQTIFFKKRKEWKSIIIITTTTTRLSQVENIIINHQWICYSKFGCLVEFSDTASCTSIRSDLSSLDFSHRLWFKKLSTYNSFAIFAMRIALSKYVCGMPVFLNFILWIDYGASWFWDIWWIGIEQFKKFRHLNEYTWNRWFNVTRPKFGGTGSEFNLSTLATR